MHGDSNCLTGAPYFPFPALEPETSDSSIGFSQEQQAELAMQLARRPRVRHWRFLRAVQLFEDGLQPSEIAAELNCTPAEVARWIELGKLGGFQEATAHHRPGRAKLLDARANEFLSSLLQSDPGSHGHRADRWTIPLLREELIHAGYTASDSTVWRAARRLGWSHGREPLPDSETFDDWSIHTAPYEDDSGRTESMNTND